MVTEEDKYTLFKIYGGILVFFCVFINVWGFSMTNNPSFIKEDVAPSFITTTTSGIVTAGYVVIMFGIFTGLLGVWLLIKGYLNSGSGMSYHRSDEEA